MSDTPNVHVKKVGWQKISSEVKGANEELWKSLQPVMSKLKRQKGSPQLIVAEYPYGSLLVDDGSFRLPCDDLPGDCSAECNEIRSELNYSYIPLGLVLDNSVEVFIMREGGYMKMGTRLVPLRVLSKGELFGVFETLDSITGIRNPKPYWSVSSGARSVVIMAPLNDKAVLKKIDNGFSCSVPRLDAGHHDWEFIQCVAQAQGLHWRTRVLLFPKWVTDEDPLLTVLQKDIFTTGWHQIAPLRSYVIDEAKIAKTFMHHSSKRVSRHTAELYYYFTLRHILAISKGELPAFQPVTPAREQSGPFLQFQDAMNSINVLKYYPVILQPGILAARGDAGYYSVNRPSLLSPVPEKFPLKTRKELVEEIERALDGLPAKARDDANLDFNEMRFYSDWGRNSSSRKNIATLRARNVRQRYVEALYERKGEFLSPTLPGSPNLNGEPKIFHNSGFFDGAIRIVRK
jgi:hypothetical protein